MKKTSICELVNLSFLIILWGGLNLFSYCVMNYREIWQLVLVLIITLPISGYLIQYIVSPIVNTLIMGKVEKP